jgi:hypothetical protein
LTITVVWEPKKAAMRDLILLALCNAEGSEIVDRPSGQINSILRERIGIPSTKNNMTTISNVLLMMEQDGYINRDKGNKRTYGISLARVLSAETIADLRISEGANKFHFTQHDAAEAPSEQRETTVVPHDHKYALLVEDCGRALDAIRKAARTAKHRTNHDLVVINVNRALQNIGIRGPRAEEIRYYLRQLGLAKAMGQSDIKAGRVYLWKWQVDLDTPLDDDRLQRLASGDSSYERHKAYGQGRNPLEDGARERTFAGDAPAVLPDHLVGPVVVTRVTTTQVRTEEAAVTTETTATVRQETSPSATDPLAELLVIIDQLEADKRGLEARIEELTAAHADEVRGLNERIDTLTAQLNARRESVEKAQQVIARYRQP